jgi:hypothetical protein
MRRLFVRHLFTLCWTLSLLLFVAACAMWARSLWKGDVVVWTGRHSLVLRSERGLVRTNVSLAEPGEPRGFRHDSWSHAPGYSAWRWLGSRWWDRMGFGHYVGGSQSGGRIDQYVFPYYAVVALTALLPGFVLTRWLCARRRRRAGLCRRCGYDLRASPQRCPECGTPA